MKPILDMTCGGRMMWFDKNNPHAVFFDKRSESHILCDGREYEIKPDVQGDWCALPFADESFSLVVFDPPHLKHLGNNSWIAKKYGKLLSDWRDEFREAGKEAMRVLKPNGVFVFKWCAVEIPVMDAVNAIGLKPLFGQTRADRGKTHWVCYMKGVSDK